MSSSLDVRVTAAGRYRVIPAVSAGGAGESDFEATFDLA